MNFSRKLSERSNSSAVPKLVPKKVSDSQPDFLANLYRIAEIAAQYKAINIRAYDVRGLTLVTDCFLMCSANSDRQLKALFNGIREGMKEAGVKPVTSEGDFEGSWLLLDYSDVIVHIFREEAREFYDLDGLWGDATPVELKLD